MDVADVSYIQGYLFLGYSGGPCHRTMDFFPTAFIDRIDLISLFVYLFNGGRAPINPSPVEPGFDPIPDDLGCLDYPNQHHPWPRTTDPRLRLGFEGCPAEIAGEPGSKMSFEVYVTLTLAEGAPWFVNSWSLSAGGENLRFLPGTATSGFNCGANEGLDPGQKVRILPYEEIFCSATVVDPQKVPASGPLAGAPQGEGMVDGLVLDWGKIQAIRDPGAYRILKVTVEVTLPEQEGVSTAHLFFVDGKQGMGEPVLNVVAGNGRDASVPVLGECMIPRRAFHGGRQLPGDANQDAAVDQSDAVWLLEHLFLGTYPSLPCEGKTAPAPGPGELALLDFNGNGGIDISDAVALLTWRFLGGEAHPLGTGCIPIPGCRSDVCNP